MNISIYMNDGNEISSIFSSIDIQDATAEEALTAIRAFGFGENKEECEEWKEKYSIECQHNDEIKMANDVLVKDFRTLMNDRDDWRDKSNMFEKCYKSASLRCVELLKERDEYKEIASDRDDLKIENDKVKELCEMLQNEKDELERRFKLVREDYFDMQHQVYKLMVEKDKLEKEYEKLMKDREDNLCQLKKSES